MRSLVQIAGAIGKFVPVAGRLDVDLDDARIRGHAEVHEPRIARRLIALDHDRLLQRLGRRFHGAHEFQIVLEFAHGRHEDVEHTVAGLRTHRGARETRGRLLRGRRFRGDQRGASRSARLQLATDLGMTGECRQYTRRIGRMDERIVAARGPRLRVERQAISQRRIARDQVTALAAQEPGARLPAQAVGGTGDGQHVAHHLVQPLFEHLDETRALQRVGELGIERIDVHRQAPLTPQVVERILERREHEFRIET